MQLPTIVDFDFHAFSLSGFDVTVNKQENGSTYPSIDWVGAIFSGSQKIWQPLYVQRLPATQASKK